MLRMLEVTEDDIAALSDGDLRALVGYLCQSELRGRNLSTVAVTWGGNQDANDGGVDVRVELENQGIEGFIPRPATGFQVKKSDLARSAILGEMRPGGVLRAAIRDLAARNGAYIIVSGASITDSMLRNRREAMREAVRDLPNRDAIFLNFYDQRRLATWVVDHPGLIPWVKEKIGRRITGWRSYGAWAHPAGGVAEKYLLDDNLRIREVGGGRNGEVKTSEGMDRIRQCLRDPGGVVRLVGLSGVGKTRLAQALFDGRIGDGYLDPGLALYTDVAENPDPPPVAALSGLIDSGQRAILVIDNCAPSLHASLSAICRRPGSLASLISIEYDIREDQPEGTSVFSLEPSSTPLIEELLKRRCPRLSAVDARTVADLSGGNARVAIALAGTIADGGSIRGLRDEEVFSRLFEQRNKPDNSLLLAAQALSLVYSFDGEDISNEGELFRLGALIGQSPEEMFRSCVQLEERQLVQRRAVWRAVLPHAIANRLAERALRAIPYEVIENNVVMIGTERLLTSFSRRIGYLDASNEARVIASRWLSRGGILGNPASFSDLEQTLFKNVAPAAPDAVVQAIEREIEEGGQQNLTACRRYVQLLCSIAYDAQIFDRCVAVISKLAETEEIDSRNDTAKVFASLFMIRLSGTHASLEQRLAIIGSLVNSNNPRRSALGLMALEAALEAVHFSGRYNFEFGARSRDYGYWPVGDEVRRWFGATLTVAEEIARSGRAASAGARRVIAEQFRGLWGTGVVCDDLDRVCRGIVSDQFWVEGWIAVRQTIHFDGKGLSPDVSAHLARIEEALRPQRIVESIQSIVLSDNLLLGVGLGPEDDATDDIAKTMARVASVAEELGRTVALDEELLGEVLPLVIISEGQTFAFGLGLAKGCNEPRVVWDRLLAQLADIEEEKRRINVFCGFLSSLKSENPELVSALLDESIERVPIAAWFPVLQTEAGVDEEGMDRLLRSLVVGKAPVRFYRRLSGGQATARVGAKKLRDLLVAIADKAGGWDVAIDILYMRLYADGARGESSAPDLLDAGRELLRRIEFTKNTNPQEYRLGEICRRCLSGEPGKDVVRDICQNLRAAVLGYQTYIFYQQGLLEGLFSSHPVAALDGLCGADPVGGAVDDRVLREISQLRGNP